MATMYRVLRAQQNDGEDEVWLPIAQVEGSTPQQAIRAATDGKPAAERTGTFVAVPARSFRPMTRKVETVERDNWR